MKLADSVTLDWHEGVTIDGIEFPFYVGEDVEITAGRDMLTTIRLELLVAGVVTMRDRLGVRRVYDSQEGEVREWAHRLVRDGLIERVPWLKVPLTQPRGDVA